MTPSDDDVNPFINMGGDKPKESNQISTETEVEEPKAEQAPETVAEQVPEPEAAEESVPETDAEEPETIAEPAPEPVAAESSDAGERDLPGNEEKYRSGEAAPVYVTDEPSKKKGGGSIGGAIKGMLSFFTAIPVNVDENDIEAMNDKFWLSPIIGFVFAMAALISFLIFNWASTTVAIIAAYGTILILNKFLHMDGLLDTGDAIVATGDSEKKRKAMKDVSVGAGGFVVGAFVMISTILLFGAVPAPMYAVVGFMLFIMAAEICTRVAMVTTATYGNAVPGMAHDSVDRTTEKDILLSIIVSLIFMVVIYLIAGLIHKGGPTNEFFPAYMWVGLFSSILASFGWGYMVASYANKNFGGVNGDVLGASVETGRIVILIFMIFINALAFQIAG